MNTLIVVESAFGNTRSVADAIAEGVGGATVVDVRNAGAVPECDLMVVGGPTHAFGMSRPSTREDATRKGGHGGGADEPGLREWLERLPQKRGQHAAVFDTRVTTVRHLPGSAARKAGKVLARHGCELVARPESFYVEDVAGPLAEGELERARQWGRQLVTSAVR
jgi:hypothetical protein